MPPGSEIWNVEGTPAPIQEGFGDARFGLRFSGMDATLSLHRRARNREAKESSRHAANDLVDLLGGDAERTSGTIGTSARGGSTVANIVTWTRANERRSKALLFRAGELIYLMHVDLPAGMAEEEEDTLRRHIDGDFGIHSDSQGGGTPWGQWYEKRVGFDAPMPFNLTFSMIRSALFVLVMLLVGWWRLSRMDF